MKKLLFTSVLILVLALTFYGVEARAEEPELVWRPGQPIATCFYCRNPMGPMGAWFGMGPGTMAPIRTSWMMGPEMMGPRMMGVGYPSFGPGHQPLVKVVRALEEKDVITMMESYLQGIRNPNLKLGEIKDKDAYFEVQIVTKNNVLVDTILVDKQTGWVRSIY
jgi:hypothetical protein